MTVSRLVVAAVAAVLVTAPSAFAQRHGGGHARGGAAVAGRAVPRGGAAPRVVRRPVAPRVAPRVIRVAPRRFYQPYYTFRPRVSLGLGLWLGYPMRYTSVYGYYNPYYYDAYPYPYPYQYPYPYAVAPYPVYPAPAYPPAAAYPAPGYPSSYPSAAAPSPAYPQASINASPAASGGVSFEITPSTAQVFVDGQYVGTVGQFTPMSQPLGLTPGRHHIQITAPGYRPMDFDADVVAGEVLPYQGALER